MSEIIFLGVLALIVIGPKQLPEVARTLGRFLNELKRSTSDLSSELKDQAGLKNFSFSESIARFEEIKKMNSEAENSPAAEEKPVEPEQLELAEQKDSQGNKPS